MKKRKHRICVDDAVDSLLHPSQAYEHPSEVVNDPDLSLNEKRAVLASWASDACAVEAAPALRKGPNGRLVSFDEIMDALRALDQQVSATRSSPRKKAQIALRNPKFGSGNSGHGDQGAPLQ
jgi:hypothetical protein